MYRSVKGVSSKILPFTTQFSATPPARQSDVEAGPRVQLPQHAEHDLLEPRLQGRRDVLVARLERLRAVRARGAEQLLHAGAPQGRQLGRPAVPGHGGAFDVVAEAVEAEVVAEPVAAHDVPELVEVGGLAERREAHDLVLVAVVREPEVLRHGGVVHAERVRERDLAALA